MKNDPLSDAATSQNGQSALEMVLKNTGCDYFSVTESAVGVK